LKLLCIGDAETVRGFRLAGVAGRAVADAAEASEAISAAAADSECGIIIVTDKVAAGVRRQVDAIRLEQERPLVVEVPGPDGPWPGRRSLQRVVREAVGISIGAEGNPGDGGRTQS
jgi:vacuolar-type H+-ATPase subunit F/Vma7